MIPSITSTLNATLVSVRLHSLESCDKVAYYFFFFFPFCQSDTIIPICTSGSSVSTGIIPLSRILPTLTVRLCVSAYDYELKKILLFLFFQISRSIITTLTLKSTLTASFPLDPMSILSLSSKSHKEKVKNK